MTEKQPRVKRVSKIFKNIGFILIVFILPFAYFFGWGWFVPYSFQPSYWEARKLANLKDCKGYERYSQEREEDYNTMLLYFGYKNLDELFKEKPEHYKDNPHHKKYGLSKWYNDRIWIFFNINFIPNKEVSRDNIDTISWSVYWLTKKYGIQQENIASLSLERYEKDELISNDKCKE